MRLLKNWATSRKENGLSTCGPMGRQQPTAARVATGRGTTGKHPVYLVTSVLDEATLSDKQVVEIYALRWGVELFYRHFKQTFEHRKLRSRSADNAELEGTWSLLGLWAMSLHAQVELARDGVPARRISVAKVLRAYRKSLREYKSVADPGGIVAQLVSKAVIDPYKRANKSSRDYPRKKHGHAMGLPKSLTPRRIDQRSAKTQRSTYIGVNGVECHAARVVAQVKRVRENARLLADLPLPSSPSLTQTTV